jgi:TM2 domain-containing membrane protein YozV
MANWYYYDNNGQKQGLITQQELKDLVGQGIITPETPLETDGGHKGKAGQVKGLFPEPAVNPFASPPSQQPYPKSVPVPTAAGTFCSNCGQPVNPTAVACLSCGASPKGHKKFCGTCGVPVSEVQVICTRCGAAIAKSKVASGGGNDVFGERNQYIAALLAFLLGGFGAHWFYLGFQKQGIIYICITIIGGILLLGIPSLVMWIIALVEAIRFLCISQETFNSKYVNVGD